MSDDLSDDFYDLDDEFDDDGVIPAAGDLQDPDLLEWMPTPPDEFVDLPDLLDVCGSVPPFPAAAAARGAAR